MSICGKCECISRSLPWPRLAGPHCLKKAGPCLKKRLRLIPLHCDDFTQQHYSNACGEFIFVNDSQKSQRLCPINIPHMQWIRQLHFIYATVKCLSSASAVIAQHCKSVYQAVACQGRRSLSSRLASHRQVHLSYHTIKPPSFPTHPRQPSCASGTQYHLKSYILSNKFIKKELKCFYNTRTSHQVYFGVVLFTACTQSKVSKAWPLLVQTTDHIWYI